MLAVTREIKLPLSSTNVDIVKIQMSVIHPVSSAKAIGGVLSLGFEVESSNGPSWLLIVSMVGIVAACVTMWKTQFFKSSKFEYQHVPTSSVHGRNLDIEMTKYTRPIEIQSLRNDADCIPTVSGYQTI